MPPAPPPGRDEMLVLVVTPWYPTAQNPVWGTFVRDAVKTLGRHLDHRIQVVHVDGSELTGAEVDQGRGEGQSWSVDESRPEADVRVVRRPIPSDAPRSTAMELHREALQEHAGDLLQRATHVSAHVGGPTAAAVAPLLPHRTRFTIVEHATYVRGLFADTSAAVQYRAAVARAARVMAVSDATAATLRRLCPQQSDIISAVPNPVDVDALPLRPASTGRRDRWLFVGNLVERKGVRLLLEAFAQEMQAGAVGRPGLHLTLVGDGPLREELEGLVRAQGLTDRVTFFGQVAPHEVPAHYGDHDVLVHLSAHETFGLTLVEAAASGLPVVVTRSGGPQETMVVPEGFGTCVLLPPEPTPGQVREAVAQVRTDAPPEDLRTVRDLLRTVYGQERSADLQHRYVLGTPPARPLATPLNLSLLLIFQGPRQWQRLRHGADRAADLGVRVTAVDLEDRVRQLPAGVTVLSPGAPERYNLLRQAERTVVDRLPRAALRGAGAVLPHLPDRAARPGLRALTAAERLQRRASAFSEEKVYGRVWRVVRGQSVARRVQSQPELARLERLDALVHLGGRMTQLAYREAVRHPEAVVHVGAFSATHLARWWLHAHAPDATGGSAAAGAQE
ncbi:glycosyltransferase [Ornithinimicrobium sp. W1679]|uniref:glycosyltransferase n=1 Tax=Ornithinimicrobium sp. W1679 TaxID=3418770 RepID=UPI003CF1C4DC